MPTHFTFAELAPDPSLSPWIARYWEYTVHPGAPPLHHVPPDGGTSLLVACRTVSDAALVVSGPWLEPLPVPIQPGDRFAGVRLQPGAAESLLGIPATELRNTVRPWPELRGEPTAVLARAVAETDDLPDVGRVFDAAFRPLVSSLARPDPLASDVVAFIVLSRGVIEVGGLARELGVSPRTLLRRFQRATGVSPKQFARVMRFRFAAHELIGTDARLSTVAAAAGYADHAHLTRDWADLLGITPRRLAEIIKATAHDNVSP